MSPGRGLIESQIDNQPQQQAISELAGRVAGEVARSAETLERAVGAPLDRRAKEAMIGPEAGQKDD